MSKEESVSKRSTRATAVQPRADAFTEYACDCGGSWPKSQGKKCPECGAAKL